MKAKFNWKIIPAAAAYILLFVLCSSCGLMHPACYAYAGTLMPLLGAFIYLFACSEMQCFGAAAALNGILLAVGIITGEGNPPLLIGLFLISLLSEFIRNKNGYDSIKGVRKSFIPFAYSFYAYSAHWWTDTAGSLAEAVEEMPAGYAEKMETVIGNIPMLIVMLVLTVPVAVAGIRIAEKVLKKQTGKSKEKD